jgi:hypothetical protein
LAVPGVKCHVKCHPFCVEPSALWSCGRVPGATPIDIDTFVQLEVLAPRGLIANVMMQLTLSTKEDVAGRTSRLWRTITINPATRLAERLNTALSNTEVLPTRSSNCSLQGPLA